MSKIARANQKIFGSTASTGELKQFGSLAAGAPVNVTDPEQLQALSNYLRGWYGASIGNNAPAQQDMNSICYLYAYQLAYLMQAGIAEWETGTTYYIGSLVNDGTGLIYVSITDGNIANAVSDTANWKQFYNPSRIASVVFADSPYTITTHYDILLFNATGGAITATLPTAVGKTGISLQLKKTDSSFNLVNIATTSSQTIDGVTTSTLATQNESLTVVSDGANWQVQNRRIPSVATAYTLTVGGSVSAPTPGTSTSSATWQRIGNSVRIRYLFIQTSASGAAAGSGSYLFPLPTGLVIDTSLCAVGATGNNVVGWSKVSNAATGLGASSVSGIAVAYDSANIGIAVPTIVSSVPQDTMNLIASTVFNFNATTNVIYSFEAVVPISGWKG